MIKLKIVTPNGPMHDITKEVMSITIPTEVGILGIWEDHTPIVTIITPGEMVIDFSDNTQEVYAISSGLLEVNKGSEVSILADTAERGSDIDIKRAEEAKRRAEEMMLSQDSIDDIDFAKVQALIEKELARINVGKKYKGLNIGNKLDKETESISREE
jgi:F-type H+-transporting ATPase subunit epsilon